ncbi:MULTISPECIES: hypothetical protein [unclassified Streptomyces]|uniref:hypothetical protein n=1 Tax=unclassified Streptomyces TaxID=2593676 RepID=UPI000A6C4492|nr:hypothetical protein [Streptomyces sp. CB01883]
MTAAIFVLQAAAAAMFAADAVRGWQLDRAAARSRAARRRRTARATERTTAAA